MKIVKIDKPQTSRRTYPYLAHFRGDTDHIYVLLKEGYVRLAGDFKISTDYLVPYGAYRPEDFIPVMGAVTLLNE